jgi:beta-lactamase regulating signal transducer with metallopeptidase domain
MNLALLWSNLLAYSAQVLALVAVGALLPLVFRLRHPRAHLVYCQVLLVASLVLPALQPWPRPVIVVPVSNATPTTGGVPLPPRPPATPRFPIERTVLLALGAGAVARALWLLVGLMRLRRYRANATPLYPLPAAMEAARERTGAEAVVCLSQDVGGPVTFGVLYPVILLPPAVLDQPAEAQFGIACHEFLHVRRHDWLLTVCEELAGALVWFHPAVWWLLGQIRLAREQVVDRAVVALSEARDP